MAIQGLIGTGDFVANERPLNWRQGILMRFPNGHAPLVALTSAMKKKVTDDPEFNWWERELSNTRFQLSANITAVTDPLLVLADPFGFGGGTQLKLGDILYAEATDELMRVDGAVTATSVAVERGYAGTTAAIVTIATDNPNLILIGSVYEEGASTPESIRYRATKKNNFTQIFRNSLKATRTAMQTRLRTVEEVRDAKTQSLLYHSIGMEYAFILGTKIEEAGTGGEQQRATDGIIARITADASANIVTKTAAVSWDEIEDIFLEAFRFGSQEKMAFIGNRALLTIQRMIRKADGVSIEMTPSTKEFGMDVRRLFTPYGTLVLKTHPLFNQITSNVGTYNAMDSWMLILDMANITYRPLRNSDTQYLPDRQDNGVDGLTSEYLTEAGLEVNHAKTHHLTKGLVTAGTEPP